MSMEDVRSQGYSRNNPWPDRILFTRVINVAETEQIECDDVRRRSAAYIDRELCAQARPAIATHIDECDGCRAHIAEEDQVKDMFAQVIARLGSIDVLINNAGIQKPTASHEIDIADFDRVLGVNLRGAFLCSREAIRHFLSRAGGGVILNNSSVHE